MPELERALRELGGRLDFPPTPDLAGAVEPRLAAAPRRGPRRMARALALSFAVFLLAVGTAFAVPQSRDFILEKLGLRGATVERVLVLPVVQAPGDLALGERVTLEQASARVDFEPLVPELLGAPDQVYVDESTPGGRVSLVYLPREKAPSGRSVGVLVTEFRGDLAPELIGKLVEGEAPVEPVSVFGGAPGLWIAGPPHVFFYRDARGEIREETLRLADNTLLWQRGELLLRVESGLSKADSLRVARSFQARASR